MAKLSPSFHSNLKGISELLSEWLVVDATKFLVNLNALIRVEDGEAFVDDDDVSHFRHAYQGLIQVLRTKSEEPLAIRKPSIPEVAAAPLKPATLMDIYKRSHTLQNVPVTEGLGTLLIQLITLLPLARKETGRAELTLEEMIRTLVAAGRLQEPEEQLLVSARDHDRRTGGVPINQRIFDGTDRNIRNPEDAIRSILEHHPSAARSGELSGLVYANILPRVGINTVSYYRTALAYDFAFEKTFSIDMSVQLSPQRLISELERIAGEAQGKYPGTKIETATLLKALAHQGSSKITQAHWRVLDARELYSRSRLLKEIPFEQSAEPEMLISRLMILLPLIREEVSDEALALRDILKALVEAGVIAPEDRRFDLLAALYDLYYERPIEAAEAADADGYFNSLIRTRPSLRSYEDAPLSLIVRASIATDSIAEAVRDDYLAQAEAYDEAFEKASLALEETYPTTSAALIPQFVEIAGQVIEKFAARGRHVKVPILEVLAYLSLTGKLSGDARPYIMAAAAADLSYAWKLSGVPETTSGVAAKAARPVPASVTTTPNLDAFARHVRPYLQLAAAKDFVALFERELRDDDMQTPWHLLDRLVSIRTTLEGYEHEPYTTFVRALIATGKLDSRDFDATAYLRYAAAGDLWFGRTKYLDENDLRSPERLIKRIKELRADMPGLEHEPLATFIEALAELNWIPNDAETFRSEAAIHDAILPPDDDDNGRKGGSSPAAPSGRGAPPSPAGGPGGARSAPAIQNVSAAFFAGTLFRTTAPQMLLANPMMASMPFNIGFSSTYLRA